MATIRGTSGDDTLLGTDDHDLVRGGEGHDSLFGGLGRDRLRGDTGDDHLHGGEGRDILRGGFGHDLLFGRAGDDLLFLGPGDDRIVGGSGTDTARVVGDRDGFDIRVRADGTIVVTDIDASDGDRGTDRLIGIEHLQFDDLTLDLSAPVLDLVVANADDEVSILLGDGAGGFAPPSDPTVAVGGTPRSVALGDLDHDGKLDFVTANSADGDVSIRLGDGNGAFTAVAGLPVGADPRVVALGDLDLDGRLDLVTANFDAGNVSIRLGNGDGTFRTPAQGELPAGNNPDALALGDLDRDGVLDLVVANSADDSLGVHLGRGDGTFVTVDSVGVGTAPAAVALGDLNNDGSLDLLVGNGFDGTVSVRLGRGDGSFVAASQPEIEVGDGPLSLAVGDVNSDGRLDFAVADLSDNAVVVLLGQGDGTFTDPPGDPDPILVDGDPIDVALGDVNGDTILDLLVANLRGGTVSVRLGEGDGNFISPAVPELDVGQDPIALALGDLDGPLTPSGLPSLGRLVPIPADPDWIG